MQFNIKTLKICLAILCLLPFRAVGLPQSGGATFFMEAEIKTHPITGKKIKELWKDIEGFEGYYRISNYGRVESLQRRVKRVRKGVTDFYLLKGGIMTPSIGSHGYLAITPRKGNVKYGFTIHQLVAKAFLKNLFKYRTVNHIDRNITNNFYLNLEWCSDRENITYAFYKRNKSSRYTGVSYDKTNDKWLGYAYNKGKLILKSKRYNTELEARNAYLEAIKRHGIKNKYAL